MYINIAKINFKPEGGTSGPRPESITLELNIPSTNLDQDFNIEEGYDGYAPVIVAPYDVDELFDDVVNVNGYGHSIPQTEPGNNYYNGTVDEEGLKSIGWDDNDIAALKANVWWYDWEDDNYKADKGIWGNKKRLPGIGLYSGDTDIIGVCDPDITTVDCTNMFSGCSNLKFIPEFNTHNVTNMVNMFGSCRALTSIPQLDTHNVTNMSRMFYNCDSLTSIPQLDTHNVTNMGSMFNYCRSLTSIPALDTSKSSEFLDMLNYCNMLKEVNGIDFSGATTTISRIFGYTSSKPEITKFIVNGILNVSITTYSINALTAIDFDSVKSILMAASRTTNTTAKTLEFKRSIADPAGELAALVASCSTKGWTISGLTLV